MSTLQGIGVLVVLLAVFGVCLGRGQGEFEARTLAFMTLIIANLGLMMTNRSWSATIGSILKAPNSAQWWVTGGAVTFLAIVLNVPLAREVFRFGPVHLLDVIIALSAGVLSVVWFEIFKGFYLNGRFSIFRKI